jgi:hypothetical protein
VAVLEGDGTFKTWVLSEVLRSLQMLPLEGFVEPQLSLLLV